MTDPYKLLSLGVWTVGSVTALGYLPFEVGAVLAGGFLFGGVVVVRSMPGDAVDESSNDPRG